MIMKWSKISIFQRTPPIENKEWVETFTEAVVRVVDLRKKYGNDLKYVKVEVSLYSSKW